MSSNEGSATPSCSCTTRETVSTIASHGTSPAINASTSTSFAALSTAGCVAEAATAKRARSIAGNVSLSTGSNVHSDALAHVKGFSTSARRSGQVSPSAIGKRMSGGDAWSVVAPSHHVTIECTIDCG